MPIDKLLPSRNTIERLNMGLPLKGAYLEGRIAALYTELADIGCALEQFTVVSEVIHLSKELRQFGEALDILQRDVLTKGDHL